MFNFIMKQAMKSQLKGIPEAQQKIILDAIDKNPDFFKKMAEKIKSKVDNGANQMSAMMEVMQDNKEELKKLLGQ